LAAVWDDAARARVAQAMRTTGVEYAERTVTAVTERLDAYADDWARMHTDACEATAIRGEQSAAVLDLRMGCLQRRRDALAASVEVLAQADTAVVDEAIPLVADLPALSACADVEALRAALPPPDDPALALAVEQARRELSRAEALHEVGKDVEALAILDTLPAQTLKHEPFAVEVALVQGLLLLDLKRYDRARLVLDDVAQRALAADHRRVAIQALAALGFTVGVRQLRRDEAMVFVTLARALAQGLHDRRLEALVLVDMGSVLETHADYELSIDRYEQALVILRELHGDTHPEVGTTLTNLANAWEGHGDLRKAYELHARALELERAIFGDEHPRVARLLVTNGIDLHQQGDYEAAAARFEQALAMQQRLLGPAHPDIGHTLSSLGLALTSLGRHAEAEARLRAGLELLGRTLGPESIEVVDALDNLAISVDSQGRHEEALALYRRVVDGIEAGLGPQHPRIALALNNLASALLMLHRHEEALPVMERAIAVQRAAVGPEHPRLALLEFNAAEALLGLHRTDEAEARLRKAIPVVEATFGADHVYVSYGVVALGRALLARGDREGALPLLERGVILRAAHGVPETHRAEAAFALARALGKQERARARTLAEDARAIYERAGTGHVRDVEEIDAWLREHR
jgi:serine/threonine-protein kinase